MNCKTIYPNIKSVKMVSGPICCGKSTLCAEFAQSCDGDVVKVSDIVKSVSDTMVTTRAELQDTAHLDSAIAYELIKQVGASDNGASRSSASLCSQS